MIIVIFVTSVHGMIWNDELFQDNLKTQDIAIERVGGLDNVYVLHYNCSGAFCNATSRTRRHQTLI